MQRKRERKKNCDMLNNMHIVHDGFTAFAFITIVKKGKKRFNNIFYKQMTIHNGERALFDAPHSQSGLKKPQPERVRERKSFYLHHLLCNFSRLSHWYRQHRQCHCLEFVFFFGLYACPFPRPLAHQIHTSMPQIPSLTKTKIHLFVYFTKRNHYDSVHLMTAFVFEILFWDFF